MTTPLLLRAARGESVERPPIWLMRQAGRYMKVYRDLRDRYPSFRERSEIPELAIEISLQPFRAFAPDGVILFSDILTPLPGIGIPFDIVESKGPMIDPPIRTLEQVQQLHPLEPEAACPFIRPILATLRQEVGDRAAVLGFAGAPWTLAAYAIEGKSSKDYIQIKAMAYHEPDLLHKFLNHLATAIADYLCYQIDCGAQVVQLFDSWAGQLSRQDYNTFAFPYQKRVIQKVKAVYPDVPIILYINGSAAIVDRMAATGVDIVSLDWTVDIGTIRQQFPPRVGLQGNLDPVILFAPQPVLKERSLAIIEAGRKGKYIFNLGHGVLQGTPEENVAFLFDLVKSLA
ncbi:MAG: uroporphyrinogen decarboxylase [Cyanobacteria bacterium J003]|nr:MAG: uroporphyrinogen decarboxylase [Cyanobacteria bacterium J003]